MSLSFWLVRLSSGFFSLFKFFVSQVHTGDAKSEIEAQLGSVLKEREQLRTEILNIKMETNSNVKKVKLFIYTLLFKGCFYVSSLSAELLIFLWFLRLTCTKINWRGCKKKMYKYKLKIRLYNLNQLLFFLK